MKTPKWLNSYLKDNDLKIIEDAVKMAETKTSAEIVPMVVRSSSPTGLVFPLLTFILLTILMVWKHYSPFNLMNTLPDWSFLILLLASSALSYFLSNLLTIQRLILPASEQEQMVNARAEIEFFEAGLTQTQGDTGILLFLSLMEKRAVVLADKAIAQKLPPEIWQEIIDIILNAVKKKEMGKGIAQAVAMAEKMLTPHFPIEEDDVDELKNHLIIKL